MIEQKMTYGYEDVAIVSEVVTSIEHRASIDIEYLIRDSAGYKVKKLPIFVAPMSSVLDKTNIGYFNNMGLNTIMPRNIELKDRLDNLKFGYWSAFSLDEVKENFIDKKFENNFKGTKTHILIDVANGHMQKILDYAKQLKKIYKIKNDKGESESQIVIMAGNIANPKTYEMYCNAGIDYVRVNIGGGHACITSTQTGIHYGIATLIDECSKIKNKRKLNDKFYTKIVADGGIKCYADGIKALALGADYIMIGSLFAQSYEACGKVVNLDNPSKPVDINIGLSEIFKKKQIEKLDLYREFYGMSTKKAQEEMNKTKLKTSEGTSKMLQVKWTLKQWLDNFCDYLRSAMSYCNSKTLEEFTDGSTTLVCVSNNEMNRINK